jgi:hypothetical protein
MRSELVVEKVFKPVAALGCGGEPKPVFCRYSIDDVEECAGGDVVAFVGDHETKDGAISRWGGGHQACPHTYRACRTRRASSKEDEIAATEFGTVSNGDFALTRSRRGVQMNPSA